jgi:hypothetical protein
LVQAINYSGESWARAASKQLFQPGIGQKLVFTRTPCNFMLVIVLDSKNGIEYDDEHHFIEHEHDGNPTFAFCTNP